MIKGKDIEGMIPENIISGKWEYTCKMIIPETYFPNEYLCDDPKIRADSHGGIMNIFCQKSGNIVVSGERTWRKSIKNNLIEELKTPKKWNRIYSTLFPTNQFLYQYLIEETDISGITNVTLINESEMVGWFYYVPSGKILDSPKDLPYASIKKVVKEQSEWLSLFGRVRLKKIVN